MSEAVVLAIHDEQLAEHGGVAGVRDLNALHSALARPQQLLAYGDPAPDIAALAAAYAFALARNHPFVDGNKRTSYVASVTFLVLNGYDLKTNEAMRVEIWTGLGGGSITEDQLADWLRAHINK